MPDYHDYRFAFPADGLATALGAFEALRAAGILAPGEVPLNMLGDPIVQGGQTVAFGRRGRAGLTYADEATGAPVAVPAIGDPSLIYIHIRSETAPEALPAGFDPAAFGLIPVPAEESAAVLGVWA